MPPDASPLEWTPFECDGRAFEYRAMSVMQKTRPPLGPAHGPPLDQAAPAVMILVRRLGETQGPTRVYPEGTRITVEHAIETARLFWADLAE